MRIKAFLKRMVPKVVKNRLWAAYYLYLAYSSKHWKKTNSVTIELSAVCNIHCEVCSVPNIQRVKGFMSLANFKVILDKLPPSIKDIRFNFAGEPLLNKDAFKIIRYAKEKRPDIRIRVSTNGTTLDNFPPQEILDSGLDELDICIDGITKEIHEDYRKGSDFEQIRSAAEKLCLFKAQAGAQKPKIIQMTLLSKQNAGMIREITEFAKKTGFDELHLRHMAIPGLAGRGGRVPREFMYFSKPPDFEKLREKYLPSEEYSMYVRSGDKHVIKEELSKCFSFLSPIIYYNGGVGVCCHDSEGSAVFGDLLKEDFGAVMSRMPAVDVYHKRLPICASCELSGVGSNWKEIKLK